MEGHIPPTREELYDVQMDVKHVQAVQTNHADRLFRLEKRQADDAALKSVWNSPFPSILSGTPQQGPTHTPSAEVFDDFDDEHGQNLLGSLQLDAEEEPVRRGASRANSVRFDVSAIQGSNWAQGPRSSGDFGPARPSSGFGSHPMTERSLSHKSDGRHSSAGHSVHSTHSAPSGRTSSLGLDNNFIIAGQDVDLPLDIPGPPPGLFILGTVPSIIRCWLNGNFSHSALLYAVVCTGSQKSLLDFGLIKELGLVDQLQKNVTGHCYIRLPVYLPEALVTQPTSRTNSPAPQLPTLTATFDVIDVKERAHSDRRKAIRVFLGSDTLRAHSADILFSQNLMTLYGDDRNKLTVPFVRPEDDSLFKDLCTTNVAQEKVELKATAAPFIPVEQKPRNSSAADTIDATFVETGKVSGHQLARADIIPSSPTRRAHKVSQEAEAQKQGAMINTGRDTANENTAPSKKTEGNISDQENCDDSHQEAAIDHHAADVLITDTGRRESSGGIWGSWRTGGFSNNDSDGSRESMSTSTYHRINRGGKSMKVLKPSKSSQRGRSSSAARTGAAYEPPPQRISGESRRKSQAGMSDSNGSLRWESKRTVSVEKPFKELRPITSVPRSSNPIGSASAFAWMNAGKPITTSTGAN